MIICPLLIALLISAGWMQIREGDELVRGKLVDVQGNVVIIANDAGEDRPYPVDRSARVHVHATAGPEMLRVGAVVQVEGNVDPATYSLLPGNILVWLDPRGPELRTNGGAYFQLKADRQSGQIPVVVVGVVQSVEPLRVVGGNSIFSRFYYSDEVDASGTPLNFHEFPTIGKVFQVEIREDQPVGVEIGSNLMLAGPGAEVRAYVRPRDGNIVDLTAQRTEPLPPSITGKKKDSAKGADDEPEVDEEKSTVESKPPRMKEKRERTPRTKTPKEPAEVQFQFGESMWKSGKHEAAERYFTKAMELDDRPEMANRIKAVKSGAKDE